MNVFFELFDLESGNLIEDFATEEEALEALRSAERDHGPAAISDIALLRFDDGHPTLIAMEGELVERVHRTAANRRVRVG
jgi:hypothetical protein